MSIVRSKSLSRRRIPVWIDAALAEDLERVTIPGTHPATLLRLLLRAAIREVEEIQLSEGVRRLAPLVWTAVAPRRRRPSVIERLPRIVDEHLEAIGASYATRAKVYALLLPLSPLQRLLLIAEGARVTQCALGGTGEQQWGSEDSEEGEHEEAGADVGA
ncbi:hypothetical protein HRbin28_02169 [bacterium HR28]|nr:hypothetical protein HRbin28_02169 [bacterium HR28]